VKGGERKEQEKEGGEENKREGEQRKMKKRGIDQFWPANNIYIYILYTILFL
jgi:hypothetical protein